MSTLIFTLPLHSENGASYAQTVLPTQTAGARDKEIWAIVPAAALSWHRVTLPAGLQRQASRLSPALQSLMEEPLLDEPEAMHLSMQAEWEANSPGWVAACNKAWLKQHLLQLQAMGHVVHRIVPEWAPSTVKGEVSAWVSGTPEDAWLWVNDAQGAWRLPLLAGLKYWTEQLQSLANAQDIPARVVIQADPAVADLAQNALRQLQSNNQAAISERFNTWRIEVVTAVQRYAKAGAANWDLAQFEFAAHGSARWLQKANRLWQTFAKGEAWKPARWSLALLVLAQCVGLNVAAWQLNAQVKLQRDLQKSILTQSFPNVPVVDAPLQMAKELERLQRNSGAVSARDLEWVLQAVGASLPAGQSISNLDYQVQGNGETRLQGLQLTEAQNSEFAKTLRNQGLDAQLSGAQWRIVGMKAGL
jgi:general secretion pathway protein L